MSNNADLKHGGNIFAASEQYNIPIENWTDLSTGISPFIYPVPIVPQSIYSRLPYECPKFIRAVKQYYNVEHFLAVPGSQTAIEQLPILLKQISKVNKVLIPFVGYQEHRFHFDKQQFTTNFYQSFDVDSAFTEIQKSLQTQKSHLLIIQPNNPTGIVFSTNQIKTFLKILAKDAFLIMDEAFIDANEQTSSIKLIDEYKNLIILRSVGKFFGLAGLRLGFVMATPKVLDQLETQVGKWQVSSPTQFIATQVLLDTQFHQHTTLNILQKNKDTQLQFQDIQVFASQVFVSELFVSYLLDVVKAEEFFESYAKRGILLRLIKVDKTFSLIRVGLSLKD
ncbi:MAG: aminotransferase class I/II-fold pyridoxal phosphate-dependent enzyme [Saccharospirillaceae bacterium]|nr:aminotransferase class I/II-fold pyridoxal phosphate-dependent enzyme [Pseudomonadales bacterium]NRB80060.1 aminotransferase class I/II-fold pyridoxal phosphate-dependent enzyme [Saccharospirillaceae bacterium]